MLQKGERETISPIGILALFSAVWALSRRHGEPAIAGAALDPWRPTAVITAMCVFGLEALRANCLRRATLLEAIRETFEMLRLGPSPLTVEARWQFCLAADRLALQLHEFGDLSGAPKQSRAAAGIISSTVGKLGSASDPAAYTAASATIASKLGSLLQDARTKLLKALQSTRPVIDTLLPLIEGFLVPGVSDAARRQFMKNCHQFRKGAEPDYWIDICRSATEARKFCDKLVDTLNKALTPISTPEAFLKSASVAYTQIVDTLLNLRRPTIRWCESVVREQIAHASAGNDTDFDPAELVSAIAVSCLSDSFSELEIADAIAKAGRGARPDGSWSHGQPIYLKDRVLGVWPSTPDIVWMLCTALNRAPTLKIADDVLMRFLDWTERTLNVVKYKDKELRGWSSELYRDERRIDVWTTGVVVNALLEIRQILERRVRQRCKERFTVVTPTKNLDGVFPVDLGAKHEKRLHRRLFNVARQTRRAEKDASYGFIFHGPPGSSKTALANALANEMWDSRGEDHVLIRITPADFTGLGSERLDSEARYIFRLLSRARRVTILFDEIDDLLRRRTDTEPSFLKLVVPAMLNRLQDLHDIAPSQEICFILATNYVERIDPALIRPGRMDAVIPVPYPDAFSRDAIFEQVLKGPILTGSMRKLVDRTIGLPWSEVKSAARDAGRTGAPAKILAGVNADTYPVEQYYEKYRWCRASEPLLNEFFHVLASQARDPNVNMKRLKDKFTYVGRHGGSDVEKQFAAFCKEQGR